MSLNCLSARTRVETESELEAASKLVERAFNRLQKSDLKKDRVERAIRDSKEGKTQEMETHVQWLKTQKTRLEQELGNVEKQLLEKKMQLQERAVSA